jgi:hypothetical protein
MSKKQSVQTQTNPGLEEAKNLIAQIFEHFKIQVVINVDDIYENSVAIEDVIGLIADVVAENPDNLRELAEEMSIDFTSPLDVWSSAIRETWDKNSSDEQKSLALRLAAFVKPKPGQSQAIQRISDNFIATRLRVHLPNEETIKFYPCAPSAWENISESLLDNAAPNSRVLCLFDQDLSGTSGFNDSSGSQLMKNVISKYGTGSIICGLLTHKIPDVESEFETWAGIANELSLSLDQFLPLAKIRLEDDANNLLFADGIKRTTLNLYCEQIKTHTRDIIDEASKQALEQIMKLDVYDFDHMIMQSSVYDGVWEAETFIRIYQILHRDAVRSILLAQNGGADFNDLAYSAGQISKIAIPYALSSRASEIRRAELYEETQTVRNSPLHAGDIFQLEVEIDGKKQFQEFVLLAQPCDLIVRGNGTRTINDLLVPLVPLEKMQKKEKDDYRSALKKHGYSYWRSHGHMLYYYENANDIALLPFKKATMIHVNVLELAVIHPEDKCYLDVATEPNIPKQLPIGWKIYLQNLFTYFKGVADALNGIASGLESIDDELKQTLWKSSMPQFTLSAEYLKIPEIPFHASIFDYKLRRIKRYREPGNSSLLKAYAEFLSRDADEHDFALKLIEADRI